MSIKKTIAVVGRPNVGKSTFVNRLVGSRKSIVDDMPGVTRDRIYFDVIWQGKEFSVIDTGGIIPGDEDEIMVNIFSQVEIAISEADEIIFIVDGKSGLNPIDQEIANILRQSKRKIYLVVNKIDSIKEFNMASEFYSLAIGDPLPLSALHGSGGVGDLLEKITEDLSPLDDTIDESSINIAIVGKPNAGKSSLINALLNQNRLIVSDISGTTRDSIDSKIEYEDQKYILIDTAGIRKKSKVDWGIEKFAVDRAIRSIRDCDIAVLVIDAVEGLTDQDKKIAQTIQQSGKGMILAINKWDLVENKQSNTTSRYEKKLDSEAPFLSYVPKIFISAKTHQRIDNIFKKSNQVFLEYKKRVSTSILNRIVSESLALNPPTSIKGKKLKVFYSTQVKDSPPTFVLFVNNQKLIQNSYKRYLEKRLREAFGFLGVTIRLSFREKMQK